MTERTYISLYELEDCQGLVLDRKSVNLPRNHGNVYRIARKRAAAFGAKSFALFVCVDVRNVDNE